jgi:hypothetical protein
MNNKEVLRVLIEKMYGKNISIGFSKRSYPEKESAAPKRCLMPYKPD